MTPPDTHRREGALAVCGYAAVRALTRVHKEKILRLYFTRERAAAFADVCRYLSSVRRPYNVVREDECERLSQSRHSQGVVAFIEAPHIEEATDALISSWAESRERVVLLDRVGNANNFGAIVRSAAFFGIRNIVITREAGQAEVTTSCYRVAEGGMEEVRIYGTARAADFVRRAKGAMFSLGTDLRAKRSARGIGRALRGKSVLLVLGNEETGISEGVRRACDALVVVPAIPGSRVESLNVAQAGSVLMYEVTA